MQLINSLIRYFSLSKWHYLFGGVGEPAPIAFGGALTFKIQPIPFFTLAVI